MSVIATLQPIGSGATRVRIAVPLDLRSTPEVRVALSEVVRRGSTPILLDMSGSTVVDSAGFATLIAAHVRAARAGRRMRIVGADARTRRLLLRAGLDRLLLNDSRAAAPRRRVTRAG